MTAAIGLGVEEVKGQITNCTIIPRIGDEEALFYARKDGTIVANLDGYVICPKEFYDGRRYRED
jgi:hypothetical protein